MRIWSIHPQYLDVKGLVALWREALLAQNVFLGNTKGYKNHPQLIRFKDHPQPLKAIANYLHIVCDEADRRAYNFNRKKISQDKIMLEPISVTSAQLQYEWEHFLKKKVSFRNKDIFNKFRNLKKIAPHPLFVVVKGYLARWE